MKYARDGEKKRRKIDRRAKRERCGIERGAREKTAREEKKLKPRLIDGLIDRARFYLFGASPSTPNGRGAYT